MSYEKRRLRFTGINGQMGSGKIILAPNPEQATCKPKEEYYLYTLTDVSQALKGQSMLKVWLALRWCLRCGGVQSLWAIDNEATLESLNYFYKELARVRAPVKLSAKPCCV